jgi:hypothetical protein
VFSICASGCLWESPVFVGCGPRFGPRGPTRFWRPSVPVAAGAGASDERSDGDLSTTGRDRAKQHGYGGRASGARHNAGPTLERRSGSRRCMPALRRSASITASRFQNRDRRGNAKRL